MYEYEMEYKQSKVVINAEWDCDLLLYYTENHQISTKGQVPIWFQLLIDITEVQLAQLLQSLVVGMVVVYNGVKIRRNV